MPPPGSGPAAAALVDVRHTAYWLDGPAPDPCPALAGPAEADLAVVGGGYTGLWTALLAKERDPGRDVALLEARTVGWAASGRNGGFCSASLTHGLRNGLDRFPTEMSLLERLGRENLDGIERAVREHRIDCSFERTGELTVATAPWQADDLRELPGLAESVGTTLEWLEQDEVRSKVDSPTYLGGVLDRGGVAMLDPARLARGLREACLRLGVRIWENTPVTDLAGTSAGVVLRTPYGRLTARHVALGTNAFPPLLRRLSSYVVPVWDYALMTEPLTDAQRAAVGWADRHGMADAGNLFHYYRVTDDWRILWGGYDAVYRFGGRTDDAMERNPETFLRLAEHFFETFPQLEGLRFTHAWGGIIDTCSRFSPFWGTAHGGRVAYAAGYTGLGVGASRFGATVVVDLLAGEQTECTAL
ncbi:MAG: FAD-dependent oxidoreductase, partial [Frankiaceae bacterium]|nr:FAD-dependent oxidoreductase [Frankiaceae bacterium]